MRDLDRRLADDAVIVTDCGHNTGLTAQYVTLRAGQAFGVSGTLASMGAGLPYAIAAALAFPGRQVVAVVGDGGLSMSLGELATCRRYDLPVKVVVLNNGALGQIRWEQMLFLGNPEFACELQSVDFAQVAEGFGFKSFRIERDEQSERIMELAFAEDGPVMIDAVVDGYEPMLPPTYRKTYMDNLDKAMERGTPHQDQIEQALTEEPAKTSLQS